LRQWERKEEASTSSGGMTERNAERRWKIAGEREDKRERNPVKGTMYKGEETSQSGD